MKTNPKKITLKVSKLITITLLLLSGAQMHAQTVNKKNKLTSKGITTAIKTNSSSKPQVSPNVTIQQQDQEKQKWIDSHPDQYIQLGGKLSNDKIGSERKHTPKNDVIVLEKRMPEYAPFPFYPSFPKYFNTGNKSQDDENYRREKDKWIEQNKFTYDSMNQVDNKNGSNTRTKSKNTN